MDVLATHNTYSLTSPELPNLTIPLICCLLTQIPRNPSNPTHHPHFPLTHAVSMVFYADFPWNLSSNLGIKPQERCFMQFRYLPQNNASHVKTVDDILSFARGLLFLNQERHDEYENFFSIRS
jgi:hypothetical protein